MRKNQTQHIVHLNAPSSGEQEEEFVVGGKEERGECRVVGNKRMSSGRFACDCRAVVNLSEGPRWSCQKQKQEKCK